MAVLTSVDGSAGVLELQFIVTKRNLLEFNLPVSLATNRGVVDLARIGTGVNTTEDSLTAVVLRRAQTEGEHRLGDDTLVDQLVEYRGDVVNGDSVVSKTENTIEPTFRYVSLCGICSEMYYLLAEGKSKTRLLGCLSEINAGQGHVTENDVVIRNKALHRA